MYVVYALVSEQDGTLYIGHTEDLERRLREHNAGKTRSTRNKTPLNVFRCEEYSARAEAVRRERKLKSGSGGEFLKNKLGAARP